MLCNKPPCTFGLKQLSVACRSAVWAGLGKDGSLLLCVASAGVAGWGAGEFQDDSCTWVLSWCWVLAESSAEVCASLCVLGLSPGVMTGPQEKVSQENTIEVFLWCLYDLASNVTQCHWHHTVLTHAVTKCHPVSRGGDIDSTSSWGSSKLPEE